jgi:beta-glucanase (GH16 family)
LFKLNCEASLLRTKLKLFGVLLCALLAVAPSIESIGGVIQISGHPVATGAGVAFFDDFSGTQVDLSKWENYNRDSDLANSELNAVRPQNAIVSGGVLTILHEHIPEGITATDSIAGSRTVYYATAQLATKQTFLYGTFEARVKPGDAAGTWPLVWLLGSGWQASQPFTANTPEHQWPNNTGGWWEIDSMEFLNGTRTANNTAAHVNSSNTQEVSLSVNASSQYIVYRLEWQPTYLRWSVDYEDGGGFQVLRTLTDTNHIPTNPGYLIVHTAIGGAGGTPNPADYPDSSLYDWVRVTQ